MFYKCVRQTDSLKIGETNGFARNETAIYFKCPADCLKLSQIVSFCTDIFQMSKIVSIFCLKLSQNKQGSTTGDIFRVILSSEYIRSKISLLISSPLLPAQLKFC